MQDDFESPNEPVERTITVGAKSATYRFIEPSSAALEKLFDVMDKSGNVDPEKYKGIRHRVIAAAVLRGEPAAITAHGEKITLEQAGKMRTPVVNALYKTAMEVIGTDKDVDAAGKD